MEPRAPFPILPRSLERRTLLLVVVGMGTIMLLYGAWLGYASGIERKQARMEVTDLLVSSTVTALGAPMWDFDKPKVRLILEGLLADKDLVSAHVHEPDGVELVAVGAGKPSGLNTRVVKADIAFDNQAIGTLIVEVDHDRIQAAVRNGLWQHAAVAVFVVTLMIALLAFIGAHAMRPLRQIKIAIDQVSKGNLTRAVPVHAIHKDIDAVATAIEGFRLNAIEMGRMRELQDRTAATERARVHAAVESSDSATLILDENHDVVFANEAARKMFPGLDVAPLHNLAQHFERSVVRAMTKAVARRRKLEIEGLDGIGNRVIAFKLSPIASEDGGSLGMSILATDVSERVLTQRRIERMAHEDPLTGLPNRRKFDDDLKQLVARDGSAALLMLDLDQFKIVNDTLGHPAGDELLKQVCVRLRGCLRDGDIISRLGGDEFAVVLHGADRREDAETIARRMIAALSEPFIIQTHPVRTGTSVGIALRHTGGDSAQDLVRKADLALYRTKDRARGSYSFHRESYDREIRTRQRTEQALEKAIAAEEIEVDYQLQHSLSQGRTSGYEALARWRPKGKPPIGPGEFIPIAEDSGLIAPLTELVFYNAARTARELDARGREQRIAVNLSPVLFAGKPARLLQNACDATGCDPALLEIEVTEAVFLEQTEKNRKTLQEIREMGATIALDDFGTGYSSLSTLLAFPVDRLKIDQAFVRRLDGDRDNTKAESVVRAIIDFAHSLEIEVTAEGVETQMQLARLQSMGCDSVQGYLLGRPSPDAPGLQKFTAAHDLRLAG